MIKKILRVIVGILLFVVITFNIYNFINIKILKNDLTTIGGYSVLEVISGSMEPTIKIGDLIIIDTKVKKYNKNDIVTFYDTNGSFVTHRIVSIEDNNMMITKGDNNNTKDEAISMNNIVGKYVNKLPFLGMLLTSFKSPIFLVFILIIGVLYCYIISTDDKGKLLEDKKNVTKEEQEKKKITKKEDKENNIVKNTKETKKKKSNKKKKTTKKKNSKKKRK